MGGRGAADGGRGKARKQQGVTRERQEEKYTDDGKARKRREGEHALVGSETEKRGWTVERQRGERAAREWERERREREGGCKMRHRHRGCRCHGSSATKPGNHRQASARHQKWRRRCALRAFTRARQRLEAWGCHEFKFHVPCSMQGEGGRLAHNLRRRVGAPARCAECAACRLGTARGAVARCDRPRQGPLTVSL